MQNRYASCRRFPLSLGAALAVLVLASCGPHPEPTPAPLPVKAVPRPKAPGGAADTLNLPDADGKGGYRTINSDVTAPEAVWHVRSALNVAALSCNGTGAKQLIANYNALLIKRKAAFATAYGWEKVHFNAATDKAGQAELDRHMTRIYNYFAQPPVQSGFCRVAREVAVEALAVPATDYDAFSMKALDRLNVPFNVFYRAYAAYRDDLAAWKEGRLDYAGRDNAPPQLQMATDSAAASLWRIQLGAFSGADAARQAWARLQGRMASLSTYKAHYEPVPDRAPFVRLQLGPVSNRADAIGLCAAAAGAGLDCFPVAVTAEK